MGKIVINKNLITLATKFTRHTKIDNTDLCKYLNYRENDTVITDGHKLLSIPNTHPVISENEQSLALVPIFNWYFYKKYTSKKCTIEADLVNNCYLAMIDDEDVFAGADFKPTFPDCDRVLDGYSFDLTLNIENTADIYKKLTAIQQSIKEFNAKQKLKKLPLYDIEDARVIFYGWSGYMQADVILKDDCFSRSIAYKVFNFASEVVDPLRLMDYTRFKGGKADEPFRVGFKLINIIDCFESLKCLADSKMFSLNISFDSSKAKSSPIKFSLENGAWCIAMPAMV